MEKKTIMQVMNDTVNNYPARPALKAKINGNWETMSWKEFQDKVYIAACAFIELGLERKQALIIIGGNCPQWFIASMAAIAGGAVPVGIYTTNSPEQCQYISENSRAALAVVEDAAQLAKFKQVWNKLPDLKAIIMMKGSDPDENVYSWEELAKLAENVPESVLQDRIKKQKEKDLCTLIYTSGTTGNPKGVMLSHKNIVLTAQALLSSVNLSSEDRTISYLPLSHIAEQIVSIYGPLFAGACTYCAESIEKLGDNLREVRPTIFLGVPRIWEKIQAKIMDAAADNPPLLKKIAVWARKKGLEGGYAEQQGRAKPLLYGLADKLVFSKAKEKLGLDQCRLSITTAAPIALDTLEFFLSLGIPLYEVYGMSECTGPASVSLPGNYETGKAGPPLMGTEIKIADDGEVLLRGFHVCMGYFKNESATKEAIDEAGWLHTGDVGEVDSKGFLKITDRKKELIITAGGENIAPQVIEGMFKAVPVISQAIVIGDKRKYLSMLITLDSEKVKDEAKEAGSDAENSEEAALCQKFTAHMQKRIDEINLKLARVQTIKKFTILPKELSVEGGELTPTMKLKRRIIYRSFADIIEKMY